MSKEGLVTFTCRSHSGNPVTRTHQPPADRPDLIRGRRCGSIHDAYGKTGSKAHVMRLNCLNTEPFLVSSRMIQAKNLCFNRAKSAHSGNYFHGANYRHRGALFCFKRHLLTKLKLQLETGQLDKSNFQNGYLPIIQRPESRRCHSLVGNRPKMVIPIRNN